MTTTNAKVQIIREIEGRRDNIILIMADREYIPFYRSFFEQICACDDPKARLEMYEVIFNYAFNKIEPDFNNSDYNGLTKFFWLGARPILRKSWAQYENGCKGGAPKGNTNNKGKRKVNPKLTQSQANKNKEKDNDNYNDNDNESDSENEKDYPVTRPPAFEPPLLEGVLNYYNYKYSLDGACDEAVAVKFYNHYSARGWMMGQTQMRDWRAALDEWIAKEPQFRASHPGVDPRQAEREHLARSYAATMAHRMAEDDAQANNPLAGYPSFDTGRTNSLADYDENNPPPF